MKYGYEFGLISNDIFEKSQAKFDRVRTEINRLKSTYYKHATLDQVLRRPDVTFKGLIEEHGSCAILSEDEIQRVETEVKYEGYISRQTADIKRFKKVEKRHVPGNIDYSQIRGLSREASEKLSKNRPAPLGQASRIPGLSPCDLSLLAVHIEKLARS